MFGFEWDDEKAAYNLATHKISFETKIPLFDNLTPASVGIR